MKHLMTLALGGLLSLGLLSTDASACCKKKSNCGGGGYTTTCYQPVAYSSCGGGHKAKNRCGGCHKKMNRCSCGAPVMACGYGNAYPTYAAPMATGQYMGTPQATGQMMAPHAPGKAMGATH